MKLDDPISKEAMQFSLALTVADLRYTDFAALPVDHQFAFGASANLTPEGLTLAVLELGQIQRARAAEMLRRMTPADGQKLS